MSSFIYTDVMFHKYECFTFN